MSWGESSCCDRFPLTVSGLDRARVDSGDVPGIRSGTPRTDRLDLRVISDLGAGEDLRLKLLFLLGALFAPSHGRIPSTSTDTAAPGNTVFAFDGRSAGAPDAGSATSEVLTILITLMRFEAELFQRWKVLGE